MRKIKAKKDFVNKMLAKRNDEENMIKETVGKEQTQENKMKRQTDNEEVRTQTQNIKNESPADVAEEDQQVENAFREDDVEAGAQTQNAENEPQKNTEDEQSPEADKKKLPKKKWKFGVYQICMLIGIALMVFSAYKLISIFSDYRESNALYTNVGNNFTIKAPELEQASEGEKIDIPWYEQISVNLTGLKEQNRDVVGWIYFENMDISYPVLYSGDNESYLRTSMDGKYATAGSIFIEGANHSDFEDSHTIIYGHNMRNLSMFGTLKYFKQKGYYEDHSYFQIFVKGKVYRYQIFAFADVPADSEAIYTVPYSPSKGFQSFINGLYKTSYEDTGVTATKDDKIITLSTCSSNDDIRFVVHAVRVDEHEVNTDGTGFSEKSEGSENSENSEKSSNSEKNKNSEKK